MWHREFSTTTLASGPTVWALWSDVGSWSNWNPGLEAATLHGPFASGTEFSLKPPGQPPLTSKLLKVEEGVCFTEETAVGEVRVVVEHRIEPVGEGELKIVYGATVTGPRADEIGEAISADFPHVLTALDRLAVRTEDGQIVV